MHQVRDLRLVAKFSNNTTVSPKGTAVITELCRGLVTDSISFAQSSSSRWLEPWAPAKLLVCVSTVTLELRAGRLPMRERQEPGALVSVLKGGGAVRTRGLGFRVNGRVVAPPTPHPPGEAPAAGLYS